MDYELVEMTPEEVKQYKFGFIECLECGYICWFTRILDHMRLKHGAQV